MKKLLLVLMVVALAAFLLVGCVPVTPGEGEEGEPEICPAITIAGSYTDPVSGKTYVKGPVDDPLEVVVTFAQPTAGVSIYLVGGAWLLPYGGVELKDKSIGLFDIQLSYSVSADGKTYTASIPWYIPMWDCEPIMIKVVSCDEGCECTESFILDWTPPEAVIELCIGDCSCAGCNLSFTSTTTEACEDIVNCADDCSGFGSWDVSIYASEPFDDCCDVPCVSPLDSGSGTACPVDFTTDCLANSVLDPDGTAYVVVTLIDNVGNTTKFGGVITLNPDTCDAITFVPWPDDNCVDTAYFVYCDDPDVIHPE